MNVHISICAHAHRHIYIQAQAACLYSYTCAHGHGTAGLVVMVVCCEDTLQRQETSSILRDSKASTEGMSVVAGLRVRVGARVRVLSLRERQGEGNKAMVAERERESLSNHKTQYCIIDILCVSE